MANEVTITRNFKINPYELFNYFTQPSLIERWEYPNGMTLRVPRFEARPDGAYRYEHTSRDGIFICDGKILDFVQGKRLVQCDRVIKDPNGKVVGENIKSEIGFENKSGVTVLSVVVSGLQDAKVAEECKTAWGQCLDHLSELIESSREQSAAL